MAVNVDHVHLFIKYPPKYSVSWIAKRIKGRSSKLLRARFPQLKELCPGHLWAPSCYHGSVGHGGEVEERYISGQKGYEKADTVPVIDEEKKPAGSDDGNEWVTFHNPSNESVDIGNWTFEIGCVITPSGLLALRN